MDGTIYLLDLLPPYGVAEFRGHHGYVRDLAFSPEGSMLASASCTFAPASQDKTVRIWDTRTGRVLLQFPSSGELYPHLAFSPDARHLLFPDQEGNACMRDALTGECIPTEEDIANCQAASVIAAGPTNFPWRAIKEGWNELAVMSTVTAQPVAWWTSLNMQLAIHPNGRTWAASEGLDKHLYLFTLEAGFALKAERAFVSLMEPPCRDGLQTVPASATAIRLFDIERQTWDAEITALCESCRRRFVVEPAVLDAIRSVASKATTDNAHASVPNSKQLRSQCHHCFQPVTFNPHVLDNRDVDRFSIAHACSIQPLKVAIDSSGTIVMRMFPPGSARAVSPHLAHPSTDPGAKVHIPKKDNAIKIANDRLAGVRDVSASMGRSARHKVRENLMALGDAVVESTVPQLDAICTNITVEIDPLRPKGLVYWVRAEKNDAHSVQWQRIRIACPAAVRRIADHMFCLTDMRGYIEDCRPWWSKFFRRRMPGDITANSAVDLYLPDGRQVSCQNKNKVDAVLAWSVRDNEDINQQALLEHLSLANSRIQTLGRGICLVIVTEENTSS
jgi:WD domain, G-beta repeat